MSNMKPAGYLNKFTGMICNPEQQPGAESEPEIYEPLVRLSDVHGLVAENEALKKDLMFWDNDDPEQPFEHPVEIAAECEMPFGTEFTVQVASRMPKRTYRVTRAEEYEYEVEMVEGAEIETPATDAFTAELRAQGVDEYALAFRENTNMDFACNRGFYHGALDFAANLRAGRNG